MNKKLIYILNHYSTNSASHFFHVLNLLEVMANKNVEVVLVIEKCDDILQINNPNIIVIPQQQKIKWLRPFELAKIILNLHSQGYTHIFIRITWVAAVIAILVSFFTQQKTFYWLSGQGGFEAYQKMPFSFDKIKLFFTSRLPFFFIKRYVYRFVTGPESMKDYFVQEGKVAVEKITILYNDIDLNRFKVLSIAQKEDLKLKLGVPSDKKIIFFAHRFSPVRKTMYYIPYVFEKFFAGMDNEYLIVMAGSGPEEKEVQEAVKESSFAKQIILLGNIPNAVIQEYYQIADVFINPTYAEGFPRVLIEAMASGLPVVTTDAGGIRDIVGKSQSEYMVPKEGREAFAQKLVQLAQSESIRKSLSTENLHTVQRFSTEAVADMYINAIFEINQTS